MKTSLLLLGILIGTASFGQFSYSLSTYTADYTPLSGATLLTDSDWNEPGNTDALTWDNPQFSVPFDFSFPIASSTFSSTFQYGSGGEMWFNHTLYNNTKFGLRDDIADAKAIPGQTHSVISYKTEGNAGNHIAKVQYEDVGFHDEIFGSGMAENRMNFQLWFYETGQMEIHYGQSHIPNPELAFGGNAGPEVMIKVIDGVFGGQVSIGFGGTILGDPADPELFIVTAGEGMNYNYPDSPGLTSVPESGRVHRFSRDGPVGILNAQAQEFSIYPTFAQSKIWVKDAGDENAAYRIIEITGKQVKTGDLGGGNPVDVSNLNCGVYIFSLAGMVKTMKLVKE